MLDSLEGTLSELDENSNQESWGPSRYVPGMKVTNSAREIPQETQQLIWLHARHVPGRTPGLLI